MAVVTPDGWVNLTDAHSLSNGSEYIVQNRSDEYVAYLEESADEPTNTDNAFALAAFGQEGNTTRYSQVSGIDLWATVEFGGVSNVVVKNSF